MSINELLAALESFLQQWQRGELLAALNERSPFFQQPLFDAFKPLTHAETLARVAELSTSQKHDEVQKQRYATLHRFLLEVSLQAAAAKGTDALNTVRTQHSFSAAAKDLTIDQALFALPREKEQQSRDAISRELDLQLKPLIQVWQRQTDAVIQSVETLGFFSAEAAFTAVLPSQTELLKQCRALLIESEPAYVDLLQFLLKRVDSGLKPSHARWADLQRVISAPNSVEFFKREDHQPAVMHCLNELGFDPFAHKRLALETRFTNSTSRGGVFAWSIPRDVRVVHLPEPGLSALALMLKHWGTALHLTHIDADLLLVNRRLGDPRMSLASGALFENLLLEVPWLKRYLRLPQLPARDAARLFAFRQLTELRSRAAEVLAAHQSRQHGSSAAALEVFASEWQSALKVEVPGAMGVLTQPMHFGPARQLGAAAMANALHGHLQQRFNEDFYRNPAAGQWFKTWASRGHPHDADAALHAEGLTPDVMAATRRLTTVMGA